MGQGGGTSKGVDFKEISNFFVHMTCFDSSFGLFMLLIMIHGSWTLNSVQDFLTGLLFSHWLGIHKIKEISH